MGRPGQAFLISCGQSPKAGKQTFAHSKQYALEGKAHCLEGEAHCPLPAETVSTSFYLLIVKNNQASATVTVLYRAN